MSGIEGQDERVVFLGMDETGRAIEVIAVELDHGLLVIDAMDMRPKWRIFIELVKVNLAVQGRDEFRPVADRSFSRPTVQECQTRVELLLVWVRM